MYIPKEFQESDKSEIYKLIKEYPLGILITHTTPELQISHLPFIINEEENKLITHIANNNPHIKFLNKKSTVIFNGPNLYITPSWYTEKSLVPTWNYITIHISGKVTLISNEKSLCTLLEKTTNYFENKNNSSWKNNLGLDLNTELRKMITGIEIKISNIEAKYKISQNRTNQSKNKLIKKMKEEGSNDALKMAEIMQRKLII